MVALFVPVETINGFHPAFHPVYKPRLSPDFRSLHPPPLLLRVSPFSLSSLYFCLVFDLLVTLHTAS